MANSSIDIKKANNHTKNPTLYKRFGNNLHWVHLESKVKNKYLGSGKQNWLLRVVSNLANVAYA
jgi:hypothetical protein